MLAVLFSILNCYGKGVSETLIASLSQYLGSGENDILLRLKSGRAKRDGPTFDSGLVGKVEN